MKRANIATTITCLILATNTDGSCCGECGIAKEIDRLFSPLTRGEKMKDNIKKMFSSKEIKIEHKTDKIQIKLILGEGIESFDGDIESDQITVNIPETGQNIVVFYDKKARFLSVGTETKKEVKEKNKESFRHESSYGSMKQGVTIDSNIDLEKTTLDYEGDTLTISIPKIVSKKESKKITVNIK